jgi:hypothetical protein
MKKELPEFKNEDEEREFWATADSREYVDWQSGKTQEARSLQAVSEDDLTAAQANHKNFATRSRKRV